MFSRIQPRHIMFAVKNDVELNDLIGDVTISQGGVIPFIHSVLLPKKVLKRQQEELEEDE